jgi:hypothetical protein
MSAKTLPLPTVSSIFSGDSLRDLETPRDERELTLPRCDAVMGFFLERVEDIDHLAELDRVHKAVGLVVARRDDLYNFAQRARLLRSGTHADFGIQLSDACTRAGNPSRDGIFR